MDTIIAQLIAQIQIKEFALIFLAVTYLGNILTIVSFSSFLTLFLFWRARYLEALVFVSGIIFAALLTQVLKLLIARPRPLISVLVVEPSFSFPSGHTLIAVVFYGFLLFLIWQNARKLWIKKIFGIIFPLLILTIGFSRIYLGVHWASDVLAGWLIGGTTLFFMIKFLRFLKHV